MLQAIWDVYRRGGVIAGTSAGAAVMSRIMYRDAPSVLKTMLHGVRMGKEIAPGLGFMRDGWFVEQHCLVRGRFARALVAMYSEGFKYGIGVDENTAIVVGHDGDVEVVGYKGALVLDLSEATSDSNATGFNLKNVRLSYLDRGDRFNLQTLEITPADEKLSDGKLVPAGEDFHPYYNNLMFYNDILGNCAVADLLGRLIDNRRDEAIGLAFDGHAALRQSVDGFEFRFYRDKDSFGWYTEDFGGEDYTVANIHLDIRPIRIAGPLYETERP
jgi:cyanophycinase